MTNPTETLIMSAHFQSVLDAYHSYRYLDAYERSRALWQPSTNIDDVPLEAIVLGGRLARFLGGFKISGHLFRVAARRAPASPLVRLYCSDARRPRTVLEDLRRAENEPELGSGDASLDSSWILQTALVWARARDFERAHRALERAAEIENDSSWAGTVRAAVWMMEDRWEDALEADHAAWRELPGHPFTARYELAALVRLQRDAEGDAFARELVVRDQSVDLVCIGISHLLRAADRALDDDVRRALLDEIHGYVDRIADLAPLADRHHDRIVAGFRADIAQIAGDRDALVAAANTSGGTYFRSVAKSIEANPGAPRHVAPHRPTYQKHDTCLPASFVTVAHAFGHAFDHEDVSRAIMYGGTPMWRLVDWCQPHGLAVEHFIIDADGAIALLEAEIPFLVRLREVDSSHAVAAVGVDLAERTLIIHDPTRSRQYRFLLDRFAEIEAPFGPIGTVVVPKADLGRLDSLPLARRVVATALVDFETALDNGTLADRVRIAEAIRTSCPDDPIATWILARVDTERGRRRAALDAYEAMIAAHPEALAPQVGLLDVTSALGNTARTIQLLASMTAQEQVPGASGSQQWIRPRPMHLARYADFLRMSTDQHVDAERYLLRALRFDEGYAPAYHVLADMLYERGDRDDSELPYRIASCLAPTNEHYARAYADVLAARGRIDEAIAWLESRTVMLGDLAEGGLPWLTLSDACRSYGRPERANEAIDAALASRPDDPELAVGAAMHLVHVGALERARALLEGIGANARASTRLQAAVALEDCTGDRANVLAIAKEWMDESPRSYEARNAYLNALADVETRDAARRVAEEWAAEHPDHELFEDLLLERLDASDDRYLAMIRARVARNPQDAYAWRQLAHALVDAATLLPKTGRAEVTKALAEAAAECERTAPNAAETFTVKARIRQLEGDWDGALDAYERALEREPRTSSVFYELRQGQDERTPEQNKRAAAMLARAVLGTPPPRADARMAAMAICANVGFVRGLEAVRSWRAACPDDPDVLTAHVEVLVRFGGTTEALEEAHGLAEEGTARFRGHVGLGMSLAEVERKLHRPEAEIAALETVLSFAPGEWSARDPLVHALARLGRTTDAVDAAREGIRVAPSWPYAWRTYAIQLWDLDRHDEALEALAEANERIPSFMELWEIRIDWLESLARGDEAIAVARSLVERFPDGAYTHLILARVLANQEGVSNRVDARAAFERAIELNANLYAAVDELAMFLVFQNEHSEAMKILDARIASGRDTRPAIARRIWVKRMQGARDEAREEMALLVQTHVDHWWAWSVLMDWMEADEAWAHARAVLGELPPTIDGLSLRVRALSLLARAGVPAAELAADWRQLTHDFPNDPRVVGPRVEQLLDALRVDEARELLDGLHAVLPDDHVGRACAARLAKVEGRQEDAIGHALDICFDEDAPEHVVVRALDIVCDEAAHVRAAERVAERIRQGRRPRVDFLVDFVRGFDASGRSALLEVMKALEPHDWADYELLATALLGLAEAGGLEDALVWFEANPELAGAATQLWQAKGRVLLLRGRYAEASDWLADWEQRSGVEMWAVSNYVAAERSRGGSAEQQLEVATAALERLVLDSAAGLFASYVCEARIELEQGDAFVEHYPAMRRLMIARPSTADSVALFDACHALLTAEDPSDARSAWLVFARLHAEAPSTQSALLLPFMKKRYAEWLSGLKKVWFELGRWFRDSLNE